MRDRLNATWLALAAAALLAPATARAQPGYPVSGTPSLNAPLPIGHDRMETGGFYTFGEFLFMHQPRALKNQVVAVRGFVDATGALGVQPGTFFGSGATALETDNLGRTSWQPGFNIGVGWKLDNGVSIYARYANLTQNTYAAGATLVPRGFLAGNLLEDSFLFSGVYNFPPNYSGPLIDTNLDFPGATLPPPPPTVLVPGTSTVITPEGNIIPGQPPILVQDPGQTFPPQGNNTYGIWNAADTMDIKFIQRYTEAELGVRCPIFDTDYSRVYSLAGGRFSWFFERFTWRTVDYDVGGNATPRDAATYSNTLSQRMYGPFVGCGHEVYLGSAFALSLDLTAAALLNISKERAKYVLGDESTQAKRSRNSFTLVPNGTANLNVWWYPIEGVQIRVGYNANAFFNTREMEQPIGFNYGGIDPVYDNRPFRLIHGFNAGIGLTF